MKNDDAHMSTKMANSNKAIGVGELRGEDFDDILDILDSELLERRDKVVQDEVEKCLALWKNLHHENQFLFSGSHINHGSVSNRILTTGEDSFVELNRALPALLKYKNMIH